MATNAQAIFELAMHLMDEINQSNGLADTADTKEYKNRTLAILDILRCEAYLATCGMDTPEPRTACPAILDFTAPIGLDDGLAQGVLPYGLAAHLLLDENPEMASFFNQRYAELLAAFARSVPASCGSIQDPYGGIELGQFAHW